VVVGVEATGVDFFSDFLIVTGAATFAFLDTLTVFVVAVLGVATGVETLSFLTTAETFSFFYEYTTVPYKTGFGVASLTVASIGAAGAFVEIYSG
jgi:hypothetical protein